MFGRLRVVLNFCLTISYEILYSEMEVFAQQWFQRLVQQIHWHCSQVLHLFHISPLL